MKILCVALLAASALFVTGTAQAGPIVRSRVVNYYSPSVSYVSPTVYSIPVEAVYVDPTIYTYSYPSYSYAPYARSYYPTYAYSSYRRGRR